jgi:hypothetical protein
MEKFLTSDHKKYSKVFLRIFGGYSNRRVVMPARPVILSSARMVGRNSADLSSSNQTDNSNETVIAIPVEDYYSNSQLLYKLRRVFFRDALPIYQELVENIITRAWSSNLNLTLFEGQNGLRVKVDIFSITHYLTIKNETVYGYNYIISINGLDPEFLGIVEPTYADFTLATIAENQTFIEFVPIFNAFEIDRIYLSIDQNEKQANIQKKLLEILNQIWLNINKAEFKNNNVKLAKNRMLALAKLDDGFYTQNKQNLIRVSVSWLVDGVEPNPIFFQRPTIENVITTMSNSNLSSYDGIPLINQKLNILVYNQSYNEELMSSIKDAWHEANPRIDLEKFYITLDEKSNKPATIINNVNKLTKRDLTSLNNKLTESNQNKYAICDLKTLSKL